MGRSNGARPAAVVEAIAARTQRRAWLAVFAVIAVMAVTAVTIKNARTSAAAGEESKASTAPALSPPPQSAPSPAPRAVEARPVPAEIRAKMKGTWVRADGDYTIILGFAEDGAARVTYQNPQPIHVAQAFAGQMGGRTGLYVELRDRGYPGSYYELIYNSAEDRFEGLYHHLGLQQTFNVVFTRAR